MLAPNTTLHILYIHNTMYAPVQKCAVAILLSGSHAKSQAKQWSHPVPSVWLTCPSLFDPLHSSSWSYVHYRVYLESCNWWVLSFQVMQRCEDVCSRIAQRMFEIENYVDFMTMRLCGIPHIRDSPTHKKVPCTRHSCGFAVCCKTSGARDYSQRGNRVCCCCSNSCKTVSHVTMCLSQHQQKCLAWKLIMKQVFI